MSLNRVLKLLDNFGFSRVEAEVYVYLAKTGPHDSQDLVEGININYQKLNLALQKLLKKGAIITEEKRVASYIALPFEELLNRYIELNMAQLQNIKINKHELLENWNNLP